MGRGSSDERLHPSSTPRHVAEDAGSTRFRRATETSFNLVLELRP
jgi:hypothetical protein